MARFGFKVNADEAIKAIKGVKKDVSTGMDREVLPTVAWGTHGRLMRATPVGFTGTTRRSWSVSRKQGGSYEVTNPKKAMLFLEVGTKAHGPVRAKFLFIPLTRRAALLGWRPSLVIGRDYVLAKRVRGIKALNIVKEERVTTRRVLGLETEKFIRDVIASR